MHVHGVSAHIASYISKYTRKGINPTGEGGAVNETQSLNNVASNRRHVHICEYTFSKLVQLVSKPFSYCVDTVNKL